MKSTKLIALLAKFERDEVEAFGRFVHSPYFNIDGDVIRLFEQLRPYFPDFSDPILTRDWIFGRIFPGEAFDDKRLRYLFSNLNKLAELFLAQQHIEKRPEQIKLAQLEEFSRRNLDKSYRQVSKTLEQDIEKGQMESGQIFLTNFLWAEVREQHFDRAHIRRFDENIQVASANLDKYYYFQRLRLACAMLDRQHILEAPYDINLSDAWFQHLEAQDYFREPVIKIYALIFRALSEEEQEEDFQTLKSFIGGLEGTLPPKDLREIYLFAINYCARKIRQGNTDYLKEAQSLYHAGIDNHILIENNQLSPWAFTNMIKISLRLGQYQEIEQFIEQYAPLLPKAFRDNALQYNLAELYYATGRIHLAQECLLKVALTDINYYLGARVMLVKIYFETDEEEALLSLLSSFIIFLKRNKSISGTIKQTYLNFCKAVFRIVRGKRNDLEQATRIIQDTELLAEREWLIRTARKARGNRVPQ